MKDKFDRWLVRHPRDQLRRTGNEVSGTGKTIFKTYWFKWPDADTFKQRLIELLICYPDGVLNDEDDEATEAIWETVTGVIREQKVLSERMIPPSVNASFEAARRQRMAHPGYSENDSWRWGRMDGYACFVNNVVVRGIRKRVTEWTRDRLRPGHHYEGHIDSITALRVDVIGRIAMALNPPNLELSAAIARMYDQTRNKSTSEATVLEIHSADAPKESASMAWSVSKPRRFHGYARPAYLFLKSQYDAQVQQKPTARDLLESLRRQPQPEIAKVLADGIDYYDSRGNTKHASLKAMAELIKRMTRAPIAR